MSLPMSNELTNLLPLERRDKLVREQRFRFGVAVAASCAFLCIAAGALLLPTYVLLSGSERVKVARLAELTSTLSSADERVLAARLEALSSSAAELIAFSNAPSASNVLRAAFAVPRPGVTISGFVYKPKAGKTMGTLVLSGTATTRNDLRRYQLALQSAQFARSANMPVSVYAKDTDISFAITITLAS